MPRKSVSKTFCCINLLDSLNISQPKFVSSRDSGHMLPSGISGVTPNECILLPNICSGSCVTDGASQDARCAICVSSGCENPFI